METTRSADGTTIAFERWGSDVPIILVAGATCARGVLQPLAEALAPHTTALSYDRRGRGDSDDASDPPPWDVEREVEDIAALIEVVGGEADLYGHSSGAAVAVHAAAAGLAVRRLVLHDAPYNAAGAGSEQDSVDWHHELHALLADGRAGDAVAAFMARVGMPDDMVAGMQQGPMWPGMVAIGPSLAYDSAAMGDETGGRVPVELLGRVAVPTLVLVGGADYGFMVDVAREMTEALPDGRSEQMVGADHGAGPEVVVPRLLPFLRG